MKKLLFNYYNYWTLDPNEFIQIILIPTITLYDSYSSRGIMFEWLAGVLKFQNIKNMKEQTKKLLDKAFEYCMEKNKSTAVSLEYMQNFANVGLTTVLEYLGEFQGFKITK